MVGASPGAAEEEITYTPEVLPCSADCTVVTERFSISSAFTCEIEPVTELFSVHHILQPQLHLASVYLLSK